MTNKTIQSRVDDWENSEPPILFKTPDDLQRCMKWLTKALSQTKEDTRREERMLHISHLSRAVGLLEGLGYPDKFLEKQLKLLRTSPKKESLNTKEK